MKLRFIIAIIFVFLLAACGGTPTAPTEVLAQPTGAPAPTEAPTPTNTAQPTPAGPIIFFDDFNGSLDPSWSWINEDPERWTLTKDGWLEINAANPGFVAEDGGDIREINVLARPAPEGSFVFTTRLFSSPDENFQQAAIYIYEDQNNYVALNIGYCAPCAVGGPGFFMETFIDNNPFEDAYMIARDPALTDVYLRLVNQDGSITGYYASEYGDWQKVGAFGNYFDFKLVGLGTTNSNPNGVENDIISQFDYFEISVSE